MNDKIIMHGTIWSSADNIYLDVFKGDDGDPKWECVCVNDILRKIPENTPVTINVELHER